MVHKFKMNGLNIALDVNGGSVHVVDDITYEVLDHYPLMNNGKLAKDGLYDLLPHYTQDAIDGAVEEIEDLIDEGMLYTDDDYINLDAFKNRKQVVKALCLNVAHDCNLKCTYCFASQGDFGGAKELMSYEVGKKSLDFLIANSGSRRNLEVDFFGGEPLMNFNVVKRLVEYGHEEAAKHDKNFRFTITTNGVLLDDKKIEYINEHMDNVVLSIDGRKTVNDKMRLTLNDKGSYDIIVPKYQKLVSSRKDKSYYIRGTFTRNNLDFSKDLEHFKELGFVHTSMEPVVSADGNPFAIREEDLPEILKEYEDFAVKYADMKVSGDPFDFFHFIVDLTQGPCVIKRITGCGAGTEYLSITPDGSIYPCHQFVGNEEYLMGNILDENLVLPQEMRDYFRESHVYSKEDCKDCWAKFYCSGGCHANAINFNNDITKPYKVGCEMQKKRLECALMIEAKRMLEADTEEEKMMFL